MAMIFFYVNAGHGAVEPVRGLWAERKRAAMKLRESAEANKDEISSARVAAPDNDNVLLAQLPSIELNALSNAIPNIQSQNQKLGLYELGSAAKNTVSKPDIRSALAERLPSSIKTVPSNFASLKDLYLPPDWKPGDLLVINVQDAHGNVEAQTNIARIIEKLSAPYFSDNEELADGVENHRENKLGANLLVGIEGASGPFNFRPYRSFPDKSITKEVAKYLLKESFITGPEYVGMTYEPPMTFWGIEQEDLYLAHVKAFKDSISEQKRALEKYEALSDLMRKVKERKLNAVLRELDAKIILQKKQQIGLGAYVQYLASVANHQALGAVSQFLTALRLEESLDYNKVESERWKLTSALTQNLPKPELKNLMSASLSYRLGNLTHSAFYQYLKELAAAYGVRLSQWPQMDQYIRYVLISEKIQAERLFNDIEAMELSALKSNTKTAEEKAVVELSQDLALVQKLVQYGLSPREWEMYESRKEKIRGIPETLLRYSKELKYSKEMGDDPKREDVSPLFELLGKFENFNRAAIARNEVLVENLLAKAAEMPRTSKERIALMVTGGFHTDGVTKLLKEKRVAYAVLMPRLGKVEGEGTEYLDIFSRDKTPLEKLFTGERITLAYPSNMSAPMGGLTPGTFVAERSFLVHASGRFIINFLRKVTNLDKNGRRNVVEALQSYMENLQAERGYLSVDSYEVEDIQERRDGGKINSITVTFTIKGRDENGAKDSRVTLNIAAKGSEIKIGKDGPVQLPGKEASAQISADGDVHTLYIPEASFSDGLKVVLSEAAGAFKRARNIAMNFIRPRLPTSHSSSDGLEQKATDPAGPSTKEIISWVEKLSDAATFEENAGAIAGYFKLKQKASEGMSRRVLAERTLNALRAAEIDPSKNQQKNWADELLRLASIHISKSDFLRSENYRLLEPAWLDFFDDLIAKGLGPKEIQDEIDGMLNGAGKNASKARKDFEPYRLLAGYYPLKRAFDQGKIDKEKKDAIYNSLGRLKVGNMENLTDVLQKNVSILFISKEDRKSLVALRGRLEISLLDKLFHGRFVRELEPVFSGAVMADPERPVVLLDADASPEFNSFMLLRLSALLLEHSVIQRGNSELHFGFMGGFWKIQLAFLRELLKDRDLKSWFWLLNVSMSLSFSIWMPISVARQNFSSRRIISRISGHSWYSAVSVAYFSLFKSEKITRQGTLQSSGMEVSPRASRFVRILATGYSLLMLPLEVPGLRYVFTLLAGYNIFNSVFTYLSGLDLPQFPGKEWLLGLSEQIESALSPLAEYISFVGDIAGAVGEAYGLIDPYYNLLQIPVAAIGGFWTSAVVALVFLRASSNSGSRLFSLAAQFAAPPLWILFFLAAALVLLTGDMAPLEYLRTAFGVAVDIGINVHAYTFGIALGFACMSIFQSVPNAVKWLSLKLLPQRGGVDGPLMDRAKMEAQNTAARPMLTPFARAFVLAASFLGFTLGLAVLAVLSRYGFDGNNIVLLGAVLAGLGAVAFGREGLPPVHWIREPWNRLSAALGIGSAPGRTGSSLGGLIGKYVVLREPRFDQESGEIKFLGRNIETGDKPEDIAIKAQPFDRENLVSLMMAVSETDTMEINEAALNIVEWLLDPDGGFAGDIFLLDANNRYGIKGIGSESIIGVSEEFKDDFVAFFHEAAEAMGAAEIVVADEKFSADYILKQLSKLGLDWYNSHMEKGGREGLMLHYAIRALQREVFDAADRRLTGKIKASSPRETAARTLFRLFEERRLAADDESIAGFLRNLNIDGASIDDELMGIVRRGIQSRLDSVGPLQKIGEGGSLEVWGHPDLDFIVKFAREDKNVDFDQLVLPGFKIVQENLGGLASSMHLDDLQLRLDQDFVAVNNVIVQQKGTPIIDRIGAIDDLDAIQGFYEQFLELSYAMWRRGVFDTDRPWLDNYAITSKDELVLIDFGHAVEEAGKVEDGIDVEAFYNSGYGLTKPFLSYADFKSIWRTRLSERRKVRFVSSPETDRAIYEAILNRLRSVADNINLERSMGLIEEISQELDRDDRPGSPAAMPWLYAPIARMAKFIGVEVTVENYVRFWAPITEWGVFGVLYLSAVFVVGAISAAFNVDPSASNAALRIFSQSILSYATANLAFALLHGELPGFRWNNPRTWNPLNYRMKVYQPAEGTWKTITVRLFSRNGLNILGKLWVAGTIAHIPFLLAGGVLNPWSILAIPAHMAYNRVSGKLGLNAGRSPFSLIKTAVLNAMSRRPDIPSLKIRNVLVGFMLGMILFSAVFVPIVTVFKSPSAPSLVSRIFSNVANRTAIPGSVQISGATDAEGNRIAAALRDLPGPYRSKIKSVAFVQSPSISDWVELRDGVLYMSVFGATAEERSHRMDLALEELSEISRGRQTPWAQQTKMNFKSIYPSLTDKANQWVDSVPLWRLSFTQSYAGGYYGPGSFGSPVGVIVMQQANVGVLNAELGHAVFKSFWYENPPSGLRVEGNINYGKDYPRENLDPTYRNFLEEVDTFVKGGDAGDAEPFRIWLESALKYFNNYHGVEMEMPIFATGGNINLLPPQFRKYFDQLIGEGEFKSFRELGGWYLSLDQEDRDIVKEYIHPTVLASIEKLNKQDPSRFTIQKGTKDPNFEAKKAAVLEQRAQRLRDFADRYAANADLTSNAWRGYIKYIYALHLKYPDVLKNYASGVDFSNIFDGFLEIEKMTPDQARVAMRQIAPQPYVGGLICALPQDRIWKDFIGNKTDFLTAFNAADQDTQAHLTREFLRSALLPPFSTESPLNRQYSDAILEIADAKGLPWLQEQLRSVFMPKITSWDRNDELEYKFAVHVLTYMQGEATGDKQQIFSDLLQALRVEINLDYVKNYVTDWRGMSVLYYREGESLVKLFAEDPNSAANIINNLGASPDVDVPLISTFRLLEAVWASGNRAAALNIADRIRPELFSANSIFDAIRSQGFERGSGIFSNVGNPSIAQSEGRFREQVILGQLLQKKSVSKDVSSAFTKLIENGNSEDLQAFVLDYLLAGDAEADAKLLETLDDDKTRMDPKVMLLLRETVDLASLSRVVFEQPDLNSVVVQLKEKWPTLQDSSRLIIAYEILYRGLGENKLGKLSFDEVMQADPSWFIKNTFEILDGIAGGRLNSRYSSLSSGVRKELPVNVYSDDYGLNEHDPAKFGQNIRRLAISSDKHVNNFILERAKTNPSDTLTILLNAEIRDPFPIFVFSDYSDVADIENIAKSVFASDRDPEIVLALLRGSSGDVARNFRFLFYINPSLADKVYEVYAENLTEQSYQVSELNFINDYLQSLGDVVSDVNGIQAKRNRERVVWLTDHLGEERIKKSIIMRFPDTQKYFDRENSVYKTWPAGPDRERIHDFVNQVLQSLKVPAAPVSSYGNQSPGAMPWLYGPLAQVAKLFGKELTVDNYVRNWAPVAESGIFGALHLFAVFVGTSVLSVLGIDLGPAAPILQTLIPAASSYVLLNLGFGLLHNKVYSYDEDAGVWTLAPAGIQQRLKIAWTAVWRLHSPYLLGTTFFASVLTGLIDAALFAPSLAAFVSSIVGSIGLHRSFNAGLAQKAAPTSGTPVIDDAVQPKISAEIQDLIDHANQYLRSLSDEELVEIVRAVSGNRDLMRVKKETIEVIYFAEGSRKSVFRVMVEAQNGEKIQLLLALKRAKFESKVNREKAITAKEYRELKILSDAGAPVPRFVREIHTEDGFEGFIEEFIDGKTAHGLLVERALTLAARRSIAEAVIKITNRLKGEAPRDLNNQNFIIRGGSDEAIMVDIGDSRLRAFTAKDADMMQRILLIGILISQYGFTTDRPGENGFIFEATANHLAVDPKKNGLQYLQEITNYLQEIADSGKAEKDIAEYFFSKGGEMFRHGANQAHMTLPNERFSNIVARVFLRDLQHYLNTHRGPEGETAGKPDMAAQLQDWMERDETIVLEWEETDPSDPSASARIITAEGKIEKIMGQKSGEPFVLLYGRDDGIPLQNIKNARLKREADGSRKLDLSSEAAEAESPFVIGLGASAAGFLISLVAAASVSVLVMGIFASIALGIAAYFISDRMDIGQGKITRIKEPDFVKEFSRGLKKEERKIVRDLVAQAGRDLRPMGLEERLRQAQENADLFSKADEKNQRRHAVRLIAMWSLFNGTHPNGISDLDRLSSQEQIARAIRFQAAKEMGEVIEKLAVLKEMRPKTEGAKRKAQLSAAALLSQLLRNTVIQEKEKNGITVDESLDAFEAAYSIVIPGFRLGSDSIAGLKNALVSTRQEEQQLADQKPIPLTDDVALGRTDQSGKPASFGAKTTALSFHVSSLSLEDLAGLAHQIRNEAGRQEQSERALIVLSTNDNSLTLEELERALQETHGITEEQFEAAFPNKEGWYITNAEEIQRHQDADPRIEWHTDAYFDLVAVKAERSGRNFKVRHLDIYTKERIFKESWSTFIRIMLFVSQTQVVVISQSMSASLREQAVLAMQQ